MNLTVEQIKKAAACQSADELAAYIKSEGIELTAEEAQQLFAALSAKELNLDELDDVSGGGGFLFGLGSESWLGLRLDLGSASASASASDLRSDLHFGLGSASASACGASSNFGSTILDN